MDKHIVSLLKQKNRVIIPELGAFIVKQSTPKTYVFNEFLKYNDGVLIEHVMKEEDITKEEATTKVDNYAEEINSRLHNGESYAIENLGILKRDRNGKVQFQPEGAGEQPAAMYAQEKPKSSDTEKEPEKPKDKKESKGEETPIELIEEPEKKEQEKKTQEKKSISDQKKETPPPVVPPVQKNEQTRVGSQPRQDNKGTTKATGTAAAAKTGKDYQYGDRNERYQPNVDPKKKGAKTGIWIALIVVAVVAIGVWVFLNRDFVFNGESGPEAETETVLGTDTEQDAGANEGAEEPAVDEGEADEGTDQIMGSETQPEEPAQAQQPAPAQGKQYYIVAGCFQNEANADAYATRLQGQGYDARKFGRYSGLSCVSFGSHTDYNEALRELNRIRSEIEPQAWILYY